MSTKPAIQFGRLVARLSKATYTMPSEGIVKGQIIAGCSQVAIVVGREDRVHAHIR